MRYECRTFAILKGWKYTFFFFLGVPCVTTWSFLREKIWNWLLDGPQSKIRRVQFWARDLSVSAYYYSLAIFDKAAWRRGRRSGTAAPQQGASAARSSSKTIGGAAVAGEEDSGEESSPQCLEHFDLFLVYLEHFNLYDGLMEHCRVRWVRRLAPSRSCEEAVTSGTAAGCVAAAGAGRIAG